MQTNSEAQKIIEKIDSFIDDCKSEIQKRKSRLNGSDRTNAHRGENSEPDALQKYVGRGRFCFNKCVEDCFDKKSVEAFKACRKRICDPKKSASEEDLKKMKALYTEMLRKYRAEELIESPPIARRLQILPNSLLDMLSEASHHFDETILNKEKK